jgi:hypothetical protein
MRKKSKEGWSHLLGLNMSWSLNISRGLLNRGGGPTWFFCLLPDYPALRHPRHPKGARARLMSLQYPFWLRRVCWFDGWRVGEGLKVDEVSSERVERFVIDWSGGSHYTSNAEIPPLRALFNSCHWEKLGAGIPCQGYPVLSGGKTGLSRWPGWCLVGPAPPTWPSRP